jgi:hypothetical protein
MKRDDSAASDSRGPKAEIGSAGQMLWLTLADTTWRVAVPTVLFAGLGIILDKKIDTMPLCTLIGMTLGLIAAGVLVWSQLKAVTKTEEKK